MVSYNIDKTRKINKKGQKNMKKLRRFLVLTLTMIFVFLGTSCADSCQSELDPSTFDDFAQEVFYMVIGNDELTLNYLFEHPEN